MHCPFCRHEDSRVVDSRSLDDGSAIRRRRQCQACGKRFTTMETTALTVVKRSGVAEPFDRSKVINGVRKACQGRPVTSDDLAMLAQEVEETVRATGNAEVDAHDVGLAILDPLRRLDQVAFLRFASVYRDFESLDDFEEAIADIRSAAQLQAVIGYIEAGNIEAALIALNLRAEFFAPLDDALRQAFNAGGVSALAGLPALPDPFPARVWWRALTAATREPNE